MTVRQKSEQQRLKELAPTITARHRNDYEYLMASSVNQFAMQISPAKKHRRKEKTVTNILWVEFIFIQDEWH